MCRWTRKLGFLLGSSWVNLVMWESSLCAPWSEQVVLWCLVVGMSGCTVCIWMTGRYAWRVVSLPCSFSGENGLLPRQEVESSTGHSPSWSLRHLAGFCKPWLKAAFLLWAILHLNPGAKCFEESLPVLFSSLYLWMLSRVIQNYCNWTSGGIKQCRVWFGKPCFI